MIWPQIILIYRVSCYRTSRFHRHLENIFYSFVICGCVDWNILNNVSDGAHFWNDSKFTSSKSFQNIGNIMFISMVPHTIGQE